MERSYTPEQIRDIAEAYLYVLELQRRLEQTDPKDDQQSFKLAEELLVVAIPNYKESVPLEVSCFLRKVNVHSLEEKCKKIKADFEVVGSNL